VNADGRRGRRAALLWAAAVAVAAAALAYFAGVTAALSLLLAVTILAVGAVSALLGGVHDERWPESTVELRSGARREVARLSWSMTDDDGRVADVAMHRLRALAAARLGERGIDLAEPPDREAAVALLGAEGYRLLTGPGRHRPDALIRCARAIERLEAAGGRPAGGAPVPPPGPAPVSPPVPAPVPRRTA